MSKSSVEPIRIIVLAATNLDQKSPSDTQFTALAQQLRAFRLFALKTSPEAFASTYEAESQRGLDHTLERLSNRKARHFIAIRDDGVGRTESTSSTQGAADMTVDDSTALLLQSQWLGMIVLLGPQDTGESRIDVPASADPFARMTSDETTARGTESGQQKEPTTNGPPSGDRTVLRYHLNGIFVHPQARRIGLGLRLIDHALDRVRVDGAESGRSSLVSVAVNEENVDAKKLYEKVGFVVVGRDVYVKREMLAEAEEKVALLMELGIER